jgi:hypothetical protein
MIGCSRRWRVAIIGIIVLLSALAFAGSELFVFTADREHAKYDLARKLPADALNFPNYTETPYFHTLFYQISNPDGTVFFSHFLLGDLGYGIKRMGMDFKLRYPDGKVHYWGGEFKAETVAIKTDRYSWTLGNNRVEGDLTTQRLHFDQDRLKADLTVKMLAPVYRIGDEGMIYLEADHKKWMQITFLTCFSAEGTISDGATVIPVKGWGYGDAVRGNFVVTDFGQICTGLRFYQDGLGVDLLEYTSTPARGGEVIPIIIVHRDGKIVAVCASPKKTVTEYYTEPRSGKKLPASFTLEGKSGEVGIRLDYTGVKLTDYNDPLKILSPLEKKVIQLVSEAPLDMRFDGQLKVSLTDSAGTVTRSGPVFSLMVYSP